MCTTSCKYILLLWGIILTSFQFQATRGFALTIYYQPTVVEAFSSVQFILENVHLGWFIRSIHRWSSGVMVLILILHIARVYLTGGLKKPREFIWITGIILAVSTVSFGVTWIFITLGPSWLLGIKNCYICSRSIR